MQSSLCYHLLLLHPLHVHDLQRKAQSFMYISTKDVFYIICNHGSSLVGLKSKRYLCFSSYLYELSTFTISSLENEIDYRLRLTLAITYISSYIQTIMNIYIHNYKLF